MRSSPGIGWRLAPPYSEHRDKPRVNLGESQLVLGYQLRLKLLCVVCEFDNGFQCGLPKCHLFACMWMQSYLVMYRFGERRGSVPSLGFPIFVQAQ